MICEPKPKASDDIGQPLPKWLIFVSKAPDDGPWLRMMITNPLNDAMCPLINEPIDIDPLYEKSKIQNPKSKSDPMSETI